MMADATPPESETPLVDEVFLAALIDDIGADGVGEAARIFLDTAPARIVRLCQASDRGHDVVRNEAHALDGSARAVGLARLGEAATALQRAASARTADPAAAERLANLLMLSMAALEGWLATQPDLT